MENKLNQENIFWETPNNVERKYINYTFGQLHYRESNPPNTSKTPLLCFHLSPNSSRVYNLFLSEMGKKRLCIAPDTPGFGQSDPYDFIPSIEDYAASFGELIDSLKLKELNLMGYHTGSKIALTLALQRPKQIKKIILVSAPIYTNEELKKQKINMGHKNVDIPTDDGEHLLKRWSFGKKWADKKVPLIFHHREIAESLKGGEQSWWGHRAAFAVNHKDLLPKVFNPILILCPNDDLWIPTQRSKNYINNGKLIELPDYGHGMLDVHTQTITNTINNFLEAKSLEKNKTKKIPTPTYTNKNKSYIYKNYIKVFDKNIHYRASSNFNKSNKPPLLCLHMSPNSSVIYEKLIKEMGKDRLVIAPDTPGFGESDSPSFPPSIEYYAIIISKFIEKLNLDKVDVIGYHTGSITCIELAKQKPNLIRKIIQISSPIYFDEEIKIRKKQYSEKKMKKDGSHLVDKWKFMVPFYGENVPRNIMARNFAEGLRGGPKAHWGHQAAFNYDLKKTQPMIDKPILIVNPNDDLYLQTPRGLKYSKNAKLFTIKKYGHGFIDLMTEEFSRTIKNFLDIKETK